MNTNHDVEIQLRSWTLRPPSDRLEAKLFGRASRARRAGFQLQWLAPAAAALVVMGMVTAQRNGPAVSGGTNMAPIVASVPSNHLTSVLLGNTPSNPAVALTGATFEWTNGRSSTSSISSLSGSRGTN